MGVKDIWSKGALEKELETLSLDMAGVSDKIGKSNDTGGTTTAGSLMAKTNALLEGKGKTSYLKTTNFNILRLYRDIEALSTYTIINLTGRGRVMFNFGSSSGNVIINVDGVERTMSSNMCLTKGNYDYLQHEFEFSKSFSITIQNTNDGKLSYFYDVSYQVE